MAVAGPWTFDHHVEQDLVISRALVELFSRAKLAAGLAFRGGTALHKLALPQAARYSEDIDLVQTSPVESRWFSGTAELFTYPLDELLGTTMRALYQRKKGRDLFDLWLALETCEVSPERAVRCFTAYLAAEGEHVTRAMFEKNLAQKRGDPGFQADMTPLLAHGRGWSVDEALTRVAQAYLSCLPGEPWRGE